MHITLTDGEIVNSVVGIVSSLLVCFQIGYARGQGDHGRTKLSLAETEKNLAKAEASHDEVRDELVKYLTGFDGRFAAAEARHLKAVADLEKSHALAVAELEEKIQKLEEALAWYRAQGGAGPGMVDFR